MRYKYSFCEVDCIFRNNHKVLLTASHLFLAESISTPFSACGELNGRQDQVSHLIACDRCGDYLRLYLDVDAADALTPTTPWSYELCGNISALPMKQFYSSRQALAMRFHSDSVRGNQTGFRGIYRFVDRGRLVHSLFVFCFCVLVILFEILVSRYRQYN